MEKLKMHSPDFTEENVTKLAELFSSCITVAKDDDGQLTSRIDFDELRQELYKSIVDGPRERYHIDWPGKKQAVVASNSPVRMTLRPDRSKSCNFDSATNLLIEGDNLHALKLLQETYLGTVKMIYIDPPYNTGKDFVYDDDFSVSRESFEVTSGQRMDDGGRLVANPTTNGRFHSDWLTMMYPRLRLARNLLRDDGVIFISIDDGELANIRKLCDEIFGEENFITQIIWKKRSTPPQDKAIGAQHDYIVVYGKTASKDAISLRPRSDEQKGRYKNPDNHPKGPWAAGDLMANVKGGRYVESLYFPIVNPETGEEHFPSSNGNWRFNKAKITELLDRNEIYFGADGKGRPKLKRFLCDVKDGITWTSLWDFVPLNTKGSSEMAEIFGSPNIFENPKPSGLIKELVRAGTHNSGLVLDFFAGSGTTGHAVLELNAEDGGDRKFILVQLDEGIGEDKEASKAGFKTISDVCRERIARVGSSMKQQHALSAPTLDVGFRFLRVADSTMKDVYYSPDAVSQTALLDQIENIKEDRTSEDLLFHVLVDWGVDLSLPITSESVSDKTVYFVDETALAACFETNISEELVAAIAKRNPLRAVFRDSGYGNDSTKINVEQIFKTISPETDVKSI